MCEARLRLNPEKCIFGVRQGKILGYIEELKPIRTKFGARLSIA
jgi:hypothetical protein